MKFPGSLIGLALIIATVGASPQAQAGTIIPPGYEWLTYDVTLKSGVNGVSQILFINQQSTGELGGWTWPYSLGPGSSSIVEEWPTFAPFPPVAATFAIGLVSNLPGILRAERPPISRYSAISRQVKWRELFDSFFPRQRKYANLRSHKHFCYPPRLQSNQRLRIGRRAVV